MMNRKLDNMENDIQIEYSKKKRFEMYTRASAAVDYLNQIYHPVSSDSVARVGGFSPEDMNTLHMQVFLEQYADISLGQNLPYDTSCILLRAKGVYLKEIALFSRQQTLKLQIKNVIAKLLIIWMKVKYCIVSFILRTIFGER